MPSKVKITQTLLLAALVSPLLITKLPAKPPTANIDYASFLAQHDMQWDRLPHRWEVAPYSGNGNIGFLFYKHKSDAQNQVSLHLGRHDYYDHRLPVDGKDYLWIYRGRLPLGRFQITTKGNIVATDLQLNLHKAELTGTITTDRGEFNLHALTHSTQDAVYFKTNAHRGESISIQWLPEVPYSSSRRTLDSGGGPKGGVWEEIKNAPYPLPPKPTWGVTGRGLAGQGSSNSVHHCKQVLYQHRGETTTTWSISGDPAAEQILLTSVHHSFPEKNSLEIATTNIQKSQEELAANTFLSSHYQWWHDYYPQSFITLNDPEKEAFYWIQMYKLGSAMRGNGPILDLMGPWYHSTFWPMVWGDLNVQLQYWTHLASNRLSLGESLPNNIDKYRGNLLKNTPERWQDSAAVSTCFPQDMLGNNHGKNPDMLAWVMHNYWLHCQFAADDTRLRDNFFPVLRQVMNSYLNWLMDNKAETINGVLKLPKSWSPEYPKPWDHNCNFTIGLIQWSAQTLLEINALHELNDPLAPRWQNLLESLPPYETDDNGLRIAKNTPFDTPHRHYSHLLPFYPLAVLTPETPDGKDLLKRSLDHWLKVTQGDMKVEAMPVTGYTATGAASMYAWLGDAEKAYHYLDFLIDHKNVSPTTMYAEGNPVIESPLSFCAALHDMLIQSWGRKEGVIRVLPACPKAWPDLAFHKLRTQGAFLVSAKRQGGETRFVHIQSLAGKPCRVITDIPSPSIAINGTPARGDQVRKNPDGSLTLTLNKGDQATLSTKPVSELSKDDLRIAPIPVPAEQQNIFGFSKKTERLPGHAFYAN
ncbi:MAG: glycosyl hydrolase family 95 catalytic domain-containing protein [Akkermansiaceae bacterium]